MGLMTQTLLLLALALATPPAAQHQHPASHDRANQGMGFDQQKTTHHFLLQKTGRHDRGHGEGRR